MLDLELTQPAGHPQRFRHDGSVLREDWPTAAAKDRQDRTSSSKRCCDRDDRSSTHDREREQAWLLDEPLERASILVHDRPAPARRHDRELVPLTFELIELSNDERFAGAVRKS